MGLYSPVAKRRCFSVGLPKTGIPKRSSLSFLNIKKFIGNCAFKRSKEIIRFHKESDFSSIGLCVKCWGMKKISQRLL